MKKITNTNLNYNICGLFTMVFNLTLKNILIRKNIEYEKLNPLEICGWKQGKYLSKHENGQIYEIYNYVNDKRHGKYLSWYEIGRIWKKFNYVDGKLHGKCLYWYYKGEIYEMCNYIDGKQGKWNTWYLTG